MGARSGSKQQWMEEEKAKKKQAMEASGGSRVVEERWEWSGNKAEQPAMEVISGSKQQWMEEGKAKWKQTVEASAGSRVWWWWEWSG